MFLTFGSLSIIEGPGLGRATQTSEGGLVEDVLQCLVPSTHSSVVCQSFCRSRGQRGQGQRRQRVGRRSGSQRDLRRRPGTRLRESHTTPGRLVRICASSRAKKRSLSSPSRASMFLLRASTSPASSATMREVISSAGRVTLWDLAAVRTLPARASAPLTPRFLRKVAIRLWPALRI